MQYIGVLFTPSLDFYLTSLSTSDLLILSTGPLYNIYTFTKYNMLFKYSGHIDFISFFHNIFHWNSKIYFHYKLISVWKLLTRAARINNFKCVRLELLGKVQGKPRIFYSLRRFHHFNYLLIIDYFNFKIYNITWKHLKHLPNESKWPTSFTMTLIKWIIHDLTGGYNL